MQRRIVEISGDPIQKFLQLCLTAQWDSAALNTARELALQDNLDWRVVIEKARGQRIGPLLYYVLRGRDFIPSHLVQALRADYEYTARRNLFLFAELKHVLQCLGEQQLPVIVLKGAALAQMVYGNSALRPMRDLDLLVARDDVASVQASLKQLGYGVPKPEIYAGATISHESQLMLVKQGPIVTAIEIHWSLIDSPYYQRRLSIDWFWQTARPFQLATARALTLGAEAQLLYLCAHLFLHHAGQDLLWLNDITQLVHFYHSELAWEELIRRAGVLGFAHPAQQVLTRIAREWGAPIPANVLEQLQALPISHDEARIMDLLASPRRPPAQRLWTDLTLMTSWRDRWRFAWSNVFPSLEYMERRYHISRPLLLPFYYPYRWWLGMRSALAKRS